jgi:hypothetical protein
MRKRPRRVLWIVAIVAAGLGALLVGGWWLRNPIASFVATRVMESQGLSCNPVQVQVPSALPPSPIQLAPMRCESNAGPLQSIEFRAPLYVDLDGLGIGLVHSESVTIALRAQAHRDVELNTLGDMTRIVGFDEPAVEMMFDSAQMSTRKVPLFLVSRANVLRAGRSIATLRDMRVTPMQTGMSMSSRDVRVDQASALGDASLMMTATPDRVLVDVHFQSNLRAKVTAEHMRALRPNVRFEIGVGENGSRTR